jgi:hypothetical protein
VAVGAPLGGNDADPLGAPAPLELLFAPALDRYRARLGAVADRALGRSWRARAYADGYLYGRTAEWAVRAGMGIDWGAWEGGRICLGAAWWNSNQQERDPRTGGRRRSNDVLPTADVIWELP